MKIAHAMVVPIVAACAVTVLGGRTGAQSAADAVGTLDVGGVKRTYVVHVPAQLPPHIPLVLSFHGHFSTGAQQSRLTHLDALSDESGFIVIYPDGVDRSWNDGRPQNAGSDDVAFVKALIADFSGRYAIDGKRVYATGFSNGASFSQYLGCSLANQIAAIAPVSGYLPAVDAASCHPVRAISVLEIGGTADPIEPYTGGRVGSGSIDRGEVRSAAQTIDMWKTNAGCMATPQVEPLNPIAPADGTSITRATYSGCRDEAIVILDTVTGGGHTWPGGPQYLPPNFVGVASQQLDATAAIVDFFYAHPMR